MHISKAALILTLTVSTVRIHAQAAAGVAQTQGPPPTQATTVVPATASSLLQPALAVVGNTLSSVNMDKWKKGSVREEAAGHVSSLQKDLQTNMPPLLATADAAPGQLSKALPLAKHLDAFYDVLLRVEEAARVSAPGDQVDALKQTLSTLNQARLTFDEGLETQAATQEKQLIDLQLALRAQQEASRSAPPVTAPAAPCKPATPARKKKSTRPAAKTPPAPSDQKKP
jgi:hypothetical protein